MKFLHAIISLVAMSSPIVVSSRDLTSKSAKHSKDDELFKKQVEDRLAALEACNSVCLNAPPKDDCAASKTRIAQLATQIKADGGCFIENPGDNASGRYRLVCLETPGGSRATTLPSMCNPSFL